MININLNDKVVLITGVSDHLGQKICLKLAEAGAEVWAHQLHDVSKTVSGQSTEEKQIKTVFGELNSIESVKAVTDHIISESGKIDILINYSQMVSKGSLSEITPEDWLHLFEENLDVPFLCCQEVIPNMLDSGGGIILNFSSQAAETGEIGAHYAASKSALNSMTKGLSNEYKDKGIRVNGLSTPVLLFDENQPEQNKQSMIEAITNMTLLLCSPLTEAINGQSITIGEKVGI